jgi:hypothetical protein
MTVHPPPLIFTSIRTFDAYLSGMEREYEAQSDGELTGAGGYDRMIRVRACLQLVRDLRERLAPSVEIAEAATVAAEESVEDRVEAQYREAGFDDLPPTVARLMDGDR